MHFRHKYMNELHVIFGSTRKKPALFSALFSAALPRNVFCGGRISTS
jgi:hypothetical protein